VTDIFDNEEEGDEPGFGCEGIGEYSCRTAEEVDVSSG
jgi:hypothetical protein